MSDRSRIWAAVKDSNGNITNKVFDVPNPVPDEMYVEKHPTTRPYYFAAWVDAQAPEMTEKSERQKSHTYAQWWWDEDARRADGEKAASFTGKY